MVFTLKSVGTFGAADFVGGRTFDLSIEKLSLGMQPLTRKNIRGHNARFISDIQVMQRGQNQSRKKGT